MPLSRTVNVVNDFVIRYASSSDIVKPKAAYSSPTLNDRLSFAVVSRGCGACAAIARADSNAARVSITKKPRIIASQVQVRRASRARAQGPRVQASSQG